MTRTRLRRESAEEQYLEAGELEVFRQLERDARQLDQPAGGNHPVPLGPFARVQTEAMLQAIGKTRGAINHLWGSQESFRAAIMANFLDDEGMGLDEVELPSPEESKTHDEWLERLARTEMRRGPRHGATPVSNYGFRWVAWLGLIPYGLWSEAIAEPSLAEYRHRVQVVANDLIAPALSRFGLEIPTRFSLLELASAFVTMVEGHWLNACLSQKDPIDQKKSLESTLATALKMLFAGATQAASRRTVKRDAYAGSGRRRERAK